MEQRYQSIARELQAEITAGAFDGGAALPTRGELAQRFGVARATMDRAVTCLVKKGVLNARRGAGTVVANQTPSRTIGFIGSDDGLLPRPVPPAGVKIQRLTSDDLLSKSARRVLRQFDGLIWSYPEDRELAWARETPPGQPQILVNRHLDDFNYVSIDHRGAIREITARRLATCPQGLPIFLSTAHADGLVWGMREQGFVDACRKANRFYEIVPLPATFTGRQAALEAACQTHLDRPLILVSGSRVNTGAVVAWVKSRGLTWQRDVYYSDFDNDYPLDIWGVAITSFIQDVGLLSAASMSCLLELMTGARQEARVLIPPTYVAGDT